MKRFLFGHVMKFIIICISESITFHLKSWFWILCYAYNFRPLLNPSGFNIHQMMVICWLRTTCLKYNFAPYHISGNTYTRFMNENVYMLLIKSKFECGFFFLVQITYKMLDGKIFSHAEEIFQRHVGERAQLLARLDLKPVHTETASNLFLALEIDLFFYAK